MARSGSGPAPVAHSWPNRAPGRVPPLIELNRLLAASDRVTRREELDEDLRMLVGPGTSLGGARPKAAIRDRGGMLAIAKFPHARDDRDIVRWEAVALALARRAGIEVPDWRIEEVAGWRVLVVRRFDRTVAFRVPFLSAMSMLGAGDDERRSYLEIADVLRAHGAAPRKDLGELWRRVVFNVLVSTNGPACSRPTSMSTTARRRWNWRWGPPGTMASECAMPSGSLERWGARLRCGARWQCGWGRRGKRPTGWSRHLRMRTWRGRSGWGRDGVPG